ncbi:hypothetical protein ACFQQB_10870 [Nonomuraea rubra]|uniref:hypothetical protein n=1 Tax=Nonomuraea rubra TaxID=46180 RepID=UPI00361A2094
MYTSPPAADPTATPQVPFGAAMRNATRYMAVAAYLDPSFRETALRELVRNRHRGVAPSHGGFDVVPVLRHCLRARSFLLAREIVLTVVLAGGLLLLTEVTIQWLAVVIPFALLTVRPLRRLSRPYKILVWFVISTLVAIPAAFAVVAVATARAISSFLEGRAAERCRAVAAVAHRGAPVPRRGGRLPDRRVPRHRSRPATRSAATAARPGRRRGDRAAAALDRRGAARERHALLRPQRVPRSRRHGPGLDHRGRAGPRAGPARRLGAGAALIEIDPVELHAFVRERLAQMSAQSHPAGIINLHIRDQIVATGRFNQLHGWNGKGSALHPLVDPGQLCPWTNLPEQVVAAVIRTPQAGARHYQRLDINSEGPHVLDPAGRVIPAVDRGTSVTAFVHLAVEGRMLYTEFVVTVLPPVTGVYRSVDELPLSSPPLLVYHALRGRWLYLFRDIVAAPVRLLRMAWQAFRQAIGVDDPRAYTAYDYGARLSLRELGAAERADTLIQELDTFKYTKLVEERLTSAVLDFLEDKGVDTTAYRRQATAVSISSTTHYEYSGNYPGAQFGGPGSQFVQNVNTQRGEANS